MRRIGTLTLLALLGCGAAYGQVATSTATTASDETTNTDTDTEATYLLGPEDVIGVFVWHEPELSVSVMVRPDGKVSLPLVDELHVGGRSPAEVRDMVAEALGRYIDNPVVSVSVEEINHAKVSVLGEVRLPGRYLMRQHISLLDAIALAGGFTEFSKRDVAIVRSGPDGVTRIKVDLAGVLEGKSDRLPALRANDAVYVR